MDIRPRAIKDFRDRFTDVSSKNVHQLIITELGHIAEQATAKFYEDSDIDQYQYLATLESHTCDECAHLDERIFNVKDRVSGKNYPLIHPYCRCTTVPYIKGITGQGKWTRNMTFDQWKQKQGIKPVKRLMPRSTGLISGALDNHNDKHGVRRRAWRDAYYREMRNSKAEPQIAEIARRSGLSKELVRKAFMHALHSKYELFDQTTYKNIYKEFDPDYDMARSFERLKTGVPLKHDIIMLKHEALEADYMDKQGMDYATAHKLARKKYNYDTAVDSWKEANNIDDNLRPEI